MLIDTRRQWQLQYLFLFGRFVAGCEFHLSSQVSTSSAVFTREAKSTNTRQSDMLSEERPGTRSLYSWTTRALLPPLRSRKQTAEHHFGQASCLECGNRLAHFPFFKRWNNLWPCPRQCRLCVCVCGFSEHTLTESSVQHAPTQRLNVIQFNFVMLNYVPSEHVGLLRP